ncbi:MAG: fibronectin type III domain-containing protein [Ilumatobacteraceae bacterium]
MKYRDVSVNKGYVERQGGATIPGAPTLVTAVAHDQQIDVTWDPVLQHGGAVITDYVVSITPAECSGGDASATENAAIITGLTNGTEYTVSVQAVNAVGTGVAASSEPVTPSPIPAVQLG